MATLSRKANLSLQTAVDADLPDFVLFCLILNLVFKHIRSSWPQDPYWAMEIIAVFDHHSQFGSERGGWGLGLWGSEVTAVVVAKWAQLTKLSSFSTGINGRIRHHTKGQKEANGVHSRGIIQQPLMKKYMCDFVLDAWRPGCKVVTSGSDDGGFSSH